MVLAFGAGVTQADEERTGLQNGFWTEGKYPNDKLPAA